MQSGYLHILKQIFLFIYIILTITLGEGSGTPLQYSCLENPMVEEPGRLQSMGSCRVGHDWMTSLSLFTFMHWRRKWQPIPNVLAWRIPGTGEPCGLPSLGSHRVRHDWSDLAAAAAATITLASLIQWTSSGRWWRTGKPGVLQYMGLQRVGCN